jgi:hypothetical protein
VALSESDLLAQIEPIDRSRSGAFLRVVVAILDDDATRHAVLRVKPTNLFVSRASE